MNYNDKLINLPTRLPTNDKEWNRFIRVLSDATLRNKDGRVFDESVLMQSVAGNKQSVQNLIPVSASDLTTSVTITIAAHTNNYDFGAVSYNAGSVTGLNHNTRYYVYADDPTFAGGAVTYLTTTDPTVITASPGRYYVGSVTTPNGTVGRLNFVGYAPTLQISGQNLTPPSPPPTSGGGGGGAGGGGEAPDDGYAWP